MKISDLGDKWYKAYEFCLRKYRVKEAANIAKYYCPKKIYKYYSFSSKYWRNNVFNGEIAFNLPSNFNDPLDSRWFLNYEEILKSRFKNSGLEWKKEYYTTFSNETYEEDLMYLKYMFYISCFSETPHSNLMWGHYADKHSGFCIEYDVASLPKNIQVLFPVVYDENTFDASKIIDMDGITDKYAMLCPYLFKSKDWAYEKEWRTFIPYDRREAPLIVETSHAISGVYFGLNSYGNPLRDELEKWADEYHITTYQMERTYRSYDLISEKISYIRSQKSTKGLLL